MVDIVNIDPARENPSSSINRFIRFIQDLISSSDKGPKQNVSPDKRIKIEELSRAT